MIYLALLLAWLLMPRKKRKRTKKRTNTTVKYYSRQPVRRTQTTPRRAQRAQRQPDPARAARDAERAAQRARKAEHTRQTAEADRAFYIARMDDLQRQLWSVDEDTEAAAATVRRDAELNRIAPGVISEKEARRHRAELDRLRRKQAALLAQIHAAEMKISKAEYNLTA